MAPLAKNGGPRKRSWSVVAIAALFVMGLLVAGALGGVSVVGVTSSSSTDTTAVATPTDTTATTATPTDTTATTTTPAPTSTDTTATTTTAPPPPPPTSPPPPAPTIATDKTAYVPGDTVLFSGTGWTPQETVHVHAADNGGNNWSSDTDVVVAADGSISGSFVLPTTFAAPFGLTATDPLGMNATTSFSDAFAAPAAPPPTIVSDKADYAPGSLVTLTGANWHAGEAVHIFVNDNIGQTWSYSADVVADASGAFTNQFTLPTTFVAVYSVTATGAPGDSAATSFTDGNAVPSPARVPSAAGTYQSVTAGGTPFDFSVAYSLAGQGNISLSTPLTLANQKNGQQTCGTAGTDIPAAWVSVVSGLPATVSTTNSPTVAYRVTVPAGTTAGTYTTAIKPDATGGGNAQTFDLCLTVPGTTTTTTTIASNANPSVFGQSVTFTATVSPSTATGTVTFNDGAATLGTGTLSGGTTTFSTSSLSVGTHSITAAYDGNSTFTGSTSSALSQVVNQASTTTSVASSKNPSTFGQSVTFTATVAPVAPGSGTPSGTVTFKDGASSIGTGTLSGGVATFTTSALTVGSHSITAVYGGDTNFTTSTSSALSQVVNQASTTTAVTSSANPSTFGQSVTFTATVSPVAPGSGTPTGSVTFKDGATPLATVALSGGQATFSTSTLSVGTHSITVVYGGDTNFSGSTSSALSQVVNQASTTTAISSSANPSVFGQSVTFTATVSPSGATGTVTFKDGLTTLGTGTLSGGTATFSISTLSVGTHSLTASYGGDTNFAGSTSSALSQVVNQSATTTTIASSANPSSFGQSVTFTATVGATAPGSGTPTGSVTFKDGTTSLGTVALSGGSASVSTSALAVGSHSITAVYSGDSNFTTSTSTALNQVVNQASTTTTVTSSANPSVFGQSVTFTATVSVNAPGVGLPTGTVTFKDGAGTLGTGLVGAGGQATFTTSTLVVGGHSITASYGGDTSFAASTSSALTQTVNKSDTTTVVVSSVNPSVVGQSVSFTATVAAAGSGSGTPTGTVTFTDGTTTLGTGTLSGGQASVSTSGLSPGPHTITASFGGDPNFNGSSGTVAQTVNKADTTTSLASSANPSVFGQAVTFTAHVTVSSPGSGTPSGAVQFKDGGVNLGAAVPVDTSTGTASFTTSALSVGSHAITADYSGDTSFNASSGSVAQTVNKADSSTSLTSNVNPSVFGQSVTFSVTVSAVAPGAGTPSGTVTFKDGASVVDTETLDAGGHASFTTSSLTVGAHPITASYAGNASFNSSSASLTQTVNKADSSTSVSSSVSPSVFGQSVTFTATVSAVGPGSGTPSGTLTFTDGAAVLGSVSLDASGHASVSTSALAVGPHTITASYAGDASFNGSSGATTQTVTKADTSTVVTSAPNPSVFGQSVTFTATVSPVASGAGSPTGTVTFSEGATVLGTGSVGAGGVASFTTSSPLSVGSHTITASYGGDSSFNSSSGTTTQTVAKANTSTSVTSSPNPSVFGQPVTFTATVSPVAPGAGSPTGTVTFSEGGVPLGPAVSLSGGSASLSTASLSVGSHTITATYSGDDSFNGGTGSLTQTVNRADTSTAVVSSPNPSVFGQSVTFTATVAAKAPGAGTPSGSVTFSEGATTLGTGTLVAGVATFSTSGLAVGSHAVTAAYSGDGNFNSSSGSTTQTVNKASTSTHISSSVSPSVFGQSVTFSADVSVVSPGAGTPTGSVAFMEGTTTLASEPLPAGGHVSFSTSALSVGDHVIKAVYSGDGSFNGSDDSLTQTVHKADTSTAVTSSPSPSVFGQAVTLTATVSPVAPGAGYPSGTVTFSDGTTVLGTGSVGTGGVATFTTSSSLAVGSHTLTASYGGDSSFNGSSGTTTQTVNKADTSTAVTSSPSPSVFGQPVTISADVAVVSPGAGTPTGSITFQDGTTTLANVAIDASGHASFSTAGLTVGVHNLTATYSGDGSFNTSNASASQTVDKADTSTSVSSSVNPSVFGQPVTLTAHVSVVSPGFGTPTGTVQFKDGGVNVGAPVPVDTSTETAALTTSGLAVGGHTITATYSGDDSFNGGTGYVLQTVNKADTTTAVSSSPNPSVFGQSVTFTATVAAKAPGAGTPGGTVTFSEGALTLGSGTLDSGGVATFSTNGLAVGSHAVTASYGGDGSFNSSSGSTTQVVDKANTLTHVSSSVSPSVFGQSVTFSADVSVVSPGAGTPTASVAFMEGSSVLDSETLSAGGHVSFSTSALSVGDHVIKAVYSGDDSFNGNTDSLTQTVHKADTSTAVTSSPSPSVFGQAVTLTATVSPVAPGAGYPSGTVTFSDGTTVLGTGSVGTGGVATFTTSSSLAVGSHTLTASYGGDSSFNGSSGTTTQTVNKADTSTAVTSSPSPSVFGQPVTFTATISVNSPGAGNPSGTVTFSDGGVPLGPAVTLTGGSASLSTASLSVGTHTITAAYSGDGSFNGSPGTATQIVNRADTATALASNNNPSKFGQSVTFAATVTPVAPGAGAPSGTVQFMDGTSNLGSPVTLSSGKAYFTTSTLSVATHAISAVYSGDGSFNTSTGTLSQVVNRADTSTTATNATATFGDASVTLTANVSSNPLTPNDGTVTFTLSGGPSPVAVSATGTVSGGVATATFPLAGVHAGDYTINASYGGNASFNASDNGGQAPAANLHVSKANQTITFAPLANKTFGDDPFTVSATAGSGDPVTFTVGASGQCTISGSTVTITGAGSCTVTAHQGGNADFNPAPDVPQPFSIGQRATTTSAANASATFGDASVTLTATVAKVGGNATPDGGTVTFTVNNGSTNVTASGPLSNGTATATLPVGSFAAGDYTINASYGGSANFSASTNAGQTPAATLHVAKRDTTTTASSATATYGDASVALSATVAPVGGSATPGSGTVTFAITNGSSTVATVTGSVASGGAATATLPVGTSLPAGTYSIIATYGGNANFNASPASAAATLKINLRDTNTTAAGTTTVLATSSTSVSALVAANGGTATPTGGTVTFTLKNSGGTVVATSSGAVTAGSAGASLAIGSLPIGTYTLIGSYSGTGNFNPSTSAAANVLIQYRWDGFLQPINDTAHTNPPLSMSIFKSGSTIPVKFQLKDVNGNPVQAANLPLWVSPVVIGTTSAPVDETVYTDPPSSGLTFRFDSTSMQYIFNWQSPKNPGAVYKICAKFDDGQTQCVNLGLR